MKVDKKLFWSDNIILNVYNVEPTKTLSVSKMYQKHFNFLSHFKWYFCPRYDLILRSAKEIWIQLAHFGLSWAGTFVKLQSTKPDVMLVMVEYLRTNHSSSINQHQITLICIWILISKNVWGMKAGQFVLVVSSINCFMHLQIRDQGWFLML